MGDLSAHFSSSELACRHCGRLPAETVLTHLLGHLEGLRALVGRPLRIVSGYRCPAHNRAVGGARRSRHVVGDAVDIEEGYCDVDQARSAGFRGIGTKRGVPTHLDLGRRRTWMYE